MSSQDLLPPGPGRIQIAGAPEGHDALLLARLARNRPAGAGAALLHVARDDARMAKLAELVAFFDPAIEVLRFPAWDCLPYDRVSPHRDIVSQRIDTLTRLLAPPPADAPRLVLTTIAAILQRLPARDYFDGALFTLERGAAPGQDGLVAYLQHHGYSRSETVNESGEFAVRGGIVDLFPPGAAQPLRVDFFGDEIETIRSFDPLTQRSSDKLDRFVLKPVGELRLEPAAIERFRSRYRERFGAATADDPLYEAVSAGRAYAGVEHWLPLFHERLETLFDYLPESAVTLDYQAEGSRNARLELIADFHRARLAYEKAEAAAGGAPYRPLPPEMLYLTATDWEEGLAARSQGLLSPFAAPEGAAGWRDAGGRKGRDFAEARAQPDVNLYDMLRAHIAALQEDRRRVAVAGYTAGSLDRLGHLLRDHGIERQRPVSAWAELTALPADHLALVTLPLDAGFETADLAIIAEADIVGDRLARPARKRKRPEQFLAELANFTEGDFVVHVDHGIGRYDGLVTLEVGGAPHDCLRMLYDGGDKLFVPVENIDVLSRYSAEDAVVQLDKLGGLGWQARKARVKQRIREIAGQLIQTAAQREIKPGQVMTPAEGLYDEFCARFPLPVSFWLVGDVS